MKRRAYLALVGAPLFVSSGCRFLQRQSGATSSPTDSLPDLHLFNAQETAVSVDIVLDPAGTAERFETTVTLSARSLVDYGDVKALTPEGMVTVSTDGGLENRYEWLGGGDVQLDIHITETNIQFSRSTVLTLNDETGRETL